MTSPLIITVPDGGENVGGEPPDAAIGWGRTPMGDWKEKLELDYKFWKWAKIEKKYTHRCMFDRFIFGEILDFKMYFIMDVLSADKGENGDK